MKPFARLRTFNATDKQKTLCYTPQYGGKRNEKTTEKGIWGKSYRGNGFE